MRALPGDKTASPVGNDEPGRLRCDVIDARMPNMSQAAQARRMGIDPGHYSRIRRGEKTPSVVVALKMAKAARTSVEKLFGRAA